MSVDIFGVSKLLPTGGTNRTWNSNWHNGSPRTFYSTSASQSTDPEVCFRGNTGTYVISGSAKNMSLDPTGEATYCQYGIAPRIYVRSSNGIANNTSGYDPSLNLTPWNSCEVTLYTLYTRNDCWQSYSGATVGWGCNHIPDSATDPNSLGQPNPNNYGDYSSRTMYGQIQCSSGLCYCKKECYFPDTVSEVSSVGSHPFSVNASYPWQTASPLNTWIGFKYIFQEYSNTLKTRLRVYMDLTNGVNGGDWSNKILDFTDTMGWSSQLTSDIPQPSIVGDLITKNPIPGSFWTGAPLCHQFLGKSAVGTSAYTPVQTNFCVFIRNDYTLPVYGAQFFKWFSIREVDTLTENPPPTIQRNINNLIDRFI